MTATPGRLWDKGGTLDALVHQFTVGDDPHWDRQLAYWDCIGSAAHARTLARAGLLTADEAEQLVAALAQIAAQAQQGEFEIPVALEDCHTAIEAALTEQLGDVGRKIHTGRSRNDQVATAMRLYLRAQTVALLHELCDFAEVVLARIASDGAVAFPGYTHLQPAMPSSVGQWLHAVYEGTLEQLRAAFDLLERLDACPLGTGAGFGVPLPLDRAYTAQLLGFTRVQRCPIDVQNSRGRMEKYFVRVAADAGAVLEKLACDLILYATAEFGLIALPEAFTTGSSIMPQKRNPDVVELLRAHAARLRSRVVELEWVTGKLPSSYHRDLQLTKEPALRAAAEIATLLQISGRLVHEFRLVPDRLDAACRPELYATQAAYALVQAGVPFRDAYRQVAQEVSAGRFVAPAPPGDVRLRPELAAHAGVAAFQKELYDIQTRVAEVAARYEQAEQTVLQSVAGPGAG